MKEFKLSLVQDYHECRPNEDTTVRINDRIVVNTITIDRHNLMRTIRPLAKPAKIM